MSDIKRIAEFVAEPWRESSYYEAAEAKTPFFWRTGTIFRSLFLKLDLNSVLELACGRGRHAEIVAPQAVHMTLMDVFPENLDYCSHRLQRYPHVDYVLCGGYDFRPAGDSSFTAIYCYDAMVHFAPELVESYLKDAARILKPGGMALFHHSNYDAPTDQHYGLNPHARNRMTLDMFQQYAVAAGLEIVVSHAIDWRERHNLDGVSLLLKRDA